MIGNIGGELSGDIHIAPAEQSASTSTRGTHLPDPWLGFRFMVNIEGIGALRFQKCQNIGVDSQPDDNQSGGRHGPGYMLPPVKWTWKRVQLVRGMAKDGSALWKWVVDTVNKRPIQPHDITLTLLAADGTPQMEWVFQQAYPTSWSLAPLDASSPANLAIETIEFAHQGVDVQILS